MAQITGNQYLNKYGYLPSGYTYTSMIEDVAPGAQYMPSAPSVANGGVSAPAPTQSYASNYNPTTANTQYQQDITGIYDQLAKSLGIPQLNQKLTAAGDKYGGFQYRDLAEVFKQYADEQGLSGLSKQIADLMAQSQGYQRTLEDLPETILAGTQDIGLSQAQLDRRTAQESRPIIRNISDLLNSVSVLGGQYERGLGQAQYLTGLAGQSDTNQLNQLATQYGIAQGAYGNAINQLGSLFPTLAGGVTTPYQQQQMAYQQQSLAQNQAQFDAEMAQRQYEYNNPRRSGGGASLDRLIFNLEQQHNSAVNAITQQLGISTTLADERTKSLVSEAADRFGTDITKALEWLSGNGIKPASISSGGGLFSNFIGGFLGKILRSPSGKYSSK